MKKEFNPKEYRNSFNNSKLQDKRIVFNESFHLVKHLPLPWKKSKRGRPPLYVSRLYAAIFVWMVYFDLRLREAGADLRLTGIESPNFRSIDWALVHKMEPGYLQTAIQLLAQKLKTHLSKQRVYYIGDATGYGHRRLDQSKKQYVDGEHGWDYYDVKIRGHTKALAVNRYYREEGLLVILGAEVGRGYYSDVKLFSDIWGKLGLRGGRFIYDSALDAGKAIEKLIGSGIQPCIKSRRNEGKPSFWRRKAMRLFRKKLYRQRGVCETIFGATKVRYGPTLRMRQMPSRFNFIMAMYAVHNLKIYLRLKVTLGLRFLSLYFLDKLIFL